MRKEYYDAFKNGHYITFTLEYSTTSQANAIKFINAHKAGSKATAGPDGGVVWYNIDGDRHVANTRDTIYFSKRDTDAYIATEGFFDEMLEVN